MREAILRDGEDGMSAEETLARWGEGKESWNAWAEELLRRKARMIEAGEWATNPFGQGDNPPTRAWLEEARADFSEQVFPEPVHFAGYIFPGPVSFASSVFSGGASFDDAEFEAGATFAHARFETAASFKRARFEGVADFDDAAFMADADFEHARFVMESDGPLVIAVRFNRSQFDGRADFRETLYTGNARFARSRFGGGMRFDAARFQHAADFASVSSRAIAAFPKAVFAGETSFADAELADEARFAEARFDGDTSFERTEFEGGALFRDARFSANCAFEAAKFDAHAGFSACRFAAPASFTGTRFKSEADLSNARFARVRFHHARFRGPVTFEGAAFSEDADFSGLRADGALTLSATEFARAPDFLNTRIGQPPRMENMWIRAPMRRFRRWGEGKRDPRPWPFRLMKVARDGLETARLRQLRHMAGAGLDHEREGAFYAQEVRAARFWRHKPVGRGAGPFWLGWLYGGISDFGRSALRPLLLWVVTTFVFALVYLGLRETPQPAIQEARFPAWPEAPSFQSTLEWLGGVGEWAFQVVANLYAAGGCVAGGASASAEALYLSFKNSLFFLPWESPLAAQRVYGCLYGLEEGGQIVPLAVSVAALVQNVIGLVLVVLAALALRNMFKRG